MTFETARALCLSLPQVEETVPFGPEVLVYKVAGKMFALLIPDEVPVRMNLKCDPERALELRDRYESILPGYHMSKKHWNTLMLDGTLPSKLVRELIEHSFDLVVESLPKKVRAEYQRK
jgi:predicted DNA-binding protein (MmcQ/YjbR family)